MKNNYKNQSGFIAIMSAIVISTILIAVTFALSTTAIFARFNVLNSEYKNISSNIADGCIDIALLELINNPSYNPTNEIKSFGTNTCTIVSITPLFSPRTIKVQAIYPFSGNVKSYTNLEVTITQNSNSIFVNNWQEVPYF